jgi:hypothetical protein
MMRAIKAFIPAVLLAYLLASVISTQLTLSQVQAMGLDVTLGTRLATTFEDMAGMASSYLPLIAIAFALGLPVAGGLSRLLPAQRAVLYALAGLVAIVALHTIMKAALGISGIAVTRSLPGLLSQGLAGAAGGYIFHLLSRGGAQPATGT